MASNQHVPEMAVRGTGVGGKAFHTHVLNTGIHKFESHVDGECDGNEAGERRNDQVKDTDILVVRAHKPAGEKAPLVFVAVTLNGCVCHLGASC